eukprot:1769557-Pyramimonas_sp.AAC.2
MREYIKHAPKRRAASAFRAPLELWHMVMFPNWRRRQAGDRGSPSKIAPQQNLSVLPARGPSEDAPAQGCPKYWNCSPGAPLHRGHKLGPAVKRAVRILPVPGK